MRTLVTTSRMPFAVDEIRKLGEAGHDVTAVDTFKASPGSHSRYAARHFEVPPPAQETEAFVDAIAGIIDEQQIEWLLPMFEEVFYLAVPPRPARGPLRAVLPRLRHAGQGPRQGHVLGARAATLGLAVAESVTATSPEELQDAIGRFEHWFARAAYGRGGLNILTNTGPLAGEGSLDDAKPTPDDPWLVQEYLEGVDRCSWSVVHHGEVVLHSTYEHAVDDRRPGWHRLRVGRRTGDARGRAEARGDARLARPGQLRLPDAPTTVSTTSSSATRARPTAARSRHPRSSTPRCSVTRPPAPVVVPAGRKREITEAVLRDMFQHLRQASSRTGAAAKGGVGRLRGSRTTICRCSTRCCRSST